MAETHSCWGHCGHERDKRRGETGPREAKGKLNQKASFETRCQLLASLRDFQSIVEVVVTTFPREAGQPREDPGASNSESRSNQFLNPSPVFSARTKAQNPRTEGETHQRQAFIWPESSAMPLSPANALHHTNEIKGEELGSLGVQRVMRLQM